MREQKRRICVQLCKTSQKVTDLEMLAPVVDSEAEVITRVCDEWLQEDEC